MKALLDPVAWVWFGSIALAIALFIRRRRKAASLLLALALGVGLAQALELHTRLLAALEQPFLSSPPLGPEPADAVVVLGGNLASFPPSYLGMELSDSVDRLFAGIALTRDGKGRALVLGGGGAVGNHRGEAQTAKDWLESWKLVPVPVLSLGVCASTREEALATAALARTNGWQKIILVSSAWHLKRASAAFRKTGLEVVPVGSDFRGSAALSAHTGLSFIPRTDSLVLFNFWLQERGGYLYYRLRSWI